MIFAEADVRPLILAAVVVLCLVIGIAGAIFGSRKPPPPPFYRERKLLTFEEAKAISEELLAETDEGLPLGGIRIPSEAAPHHAVVIGKTRSGKTTALRILMQEVLPAIVPGNDSRALILDAKQDMISLLHGMGVTCPIKILNPFDERCAAWDLAKDITEPVVAQQVAGILIPEDNSQNPFFTRAAKHLLRGVLIALIITSPGAWDFRDVVVTLQSEKLLRQLLSQVPETRYLVKKYLDAKEWSSINATIAEKMAPFEAVAAAWAKASESVSLKDWVNGEYILVLGNDESIREALNAINRTIFKRVAELILSQTESRERHTWIFLDEVRSLGELDGLTQLLTRGGSKGACVQMGYQDHDGLQEAHGDHLANEIVAQCGTFIVLRVHNSNTANSVSAVFGEYERLEQQVSWSVSPDGNRPRTITEHIVKRPLVLPSEIMDLPLTTAKDGLTAYYIAPFIGAFRSTIPGDELFASLRSGDPAVPDFIPRPVEHQYLKPFSEEDFKRLGLTPEAEEAPARRESKLKMIRSLGDGKAP